MKIFKKKEAKKDRRTVRTWQKPSGMYPLLYEDMLKQPHLLIAGATGSGKSVVINGMITTALLSAPCEKEFILIDPKRVELSAYRNIPHTIRYASEPQEIVSALKTAMIICEDRYKEMQKAGIKKYIGSDIYVIIDELADLMTTNKKEVQPLLQRLCQIGRASKIHVISATQCPLREVIPTSIKCNFDARVGLRTRSSQDSRNILEMKGCECLPRYGMGYYMKPGACDLWEIPMVDEAETDRLIAWWERQW